MGFGAPDKKRGARDLALSDEAEAKRARAKMEVETTSLRDETAALRTEKSSIAESVEALRQERETLENELKRERSEKERLEADRRQLGRDQRIHAEATARSDRSRQLVEDLFADKVAIRIDGDALQIDPGPAARQRNPERIAKTDIEPWIDDLVQKHGNLVAAVGRVEEVEDDLKKTRADLRERFPERDAQLRDEQEAETRKISEHLLRQPPGVDDSGM